MNAYNAYNQTQKMTMSDRKTQAFILRHASSWFSKVIEDSMNAEELNKALNYNLLFWTLVQAECLDNGCPLPKPLKANLISLSIYFDKKTMELFADKYPDPEILKSFININNNIAAGLEE